MHWRQLGERSALQVRLWLRIETYHGVFGASSENLMGLRMAENRNRLVPSIT